MLLLKSGVKVKVIRQSATIGRIYKVLLETHHYLHGLANHYRPRKKLLYSHSIRKESSWSWITTS